MILEWKEITVHLKDFFSISGKPQPYYLNELGLHLVLPGNLHIAKLGISKRQAKRNAKRMEKDISYRSFCLTMTGFKCLLLAKKPDNSYLACSIRPINNRNEAMVMDEYDNLRRAYIELIKSEYREYSRVYLEHFPRQISISDHPFDLSEIDIRIPERIVERTRVYHTQYNGFEVLFVMGSKNQKLIQEMSECINGLRFS